MPTVGTIPAPENAAGKRGETPAKMAWERSLVKKGAADERPKIPGKGALALPKRPDFGVFLVSTLLHGRERGHFLEPIGEFPVGRDSSTTCCAAFSRSNCEP
jgi:hypothetical protein